MPSWVIVLNPEGKMSGIYGPYTKFRAQQRADKLNVRNIIIDTVSRDERRAKQEIKEKLTDELGYEKGTKRIHSTTYTRERTHN